MPANAGAVRGNINSVIFLESVVGGTRVRYVCEVEPKGWLPTVVRPCQCLCVLSCVVEPKGWLPTVVRAYVLRWTVCRVCRGWCGRAGWCDRHGGIGCGLALPHSSH